MDRNWSLPPLFPLMTKAACALLAILSISACDTEQMRNARKEANREEYERLKSDVTEALCDTDPMERAHALSRIVEAAALEAEDEPYDERNYHEDQIFDVASDLAEKGCL